MAESQNAFIESQLKNIDALLEANRIYSDGYQAVVNRQGEIAKETLYAIFAAMEEGVLKNIPTRARGAFDFSVENLREIAQMNADMNREVFTVIRERVEERFNDWRTHAGNSVENAGNVVSLFRQ